MYKLVKGGSNVVIYRKNCSHVVVRVGKEGDVIYFICVLSKLGEEIPPPTCVKSRSKIFIKGGEVI